jgi:hypothetical protein
MRQRRDVAAVKEIWVRVYRGLEGLSTLRDCRLMKSDAHPRNSGEHHIPLRSRHETKIDEVSRPVWTHKPQVGSLVSYRSRDHIGAKAFNVVKRRAK